MTTATVDTERLKAQTDLRDLAGRLVILRKESTAELSGPCPKCGGADRFHVKEDLFFCRQCYPLENGKPHDCIEFVTWAGLASDFRGAVDYLGGRAGPAPAARRAPVAPAPKAAAWKAAEWQEGARRELAAGVARLASPAGDPGRAYLAGRGLLPETWQAWGLGYTLDAWDRPLAEHLLKQEVDPATWPALGYGVRKWKDAIYATRPAILLPWQRDQVTAIKYRFLTVPEGGLRYTSKYNGDCIAFGLQMAGQHFSTLWLIEGELNALALWQALRAEYVVNCDVVSFGADNKAAHVDPVVKSWAGRYQQVIVWADDPDKALAAMRALPGTFGLFGVRSPVVDGQKLDANAMLGQPGALARFAFAAWDSFDKDLAYIGRLQDALEAAPGLACAAPA
jgi:hypothetical protein